jgi:arylsulfatase
MAGAKKPNFLILWGDDIGIWNISHFSRGMMGYRTPNIDRVATEGVAFTDYYSQQSCTAGHSRFTFCDGFTSITTCGFILRHFSNERT